MKTRFKYLIIFLFLIFPFFANASVEITEIMYDREGTDTKREWIEIYNNGKDAVDILSIYFRENETNHKMAEYRGGSILPSFGYAVVASNPEEVVSDFDIDVIIFDSAFSLSNSGELLQIVDGDKNILDEVFYDVEIGAAGDGKSLQKIDGHWQAKTPTAGNSNTQTTEEPKEPQENIEEEGVQTSSNNSQNIINENKIIKETFHIEIIEPEYISANDPAIFTAKAYNGFGGENKYAKFYWSFGDGTSGEGPLAVHTYKNTGRYTIFLRSEYGQFSDSLKTKVNVFESPILIKNIDRVDNSFDFYNNSNTDQDIGGWSIISKERFYKIPQFTFISPKSNLKINSSVLDWEIFSDFTVMNPYGKFVNEIVEEQSVSDKEKSIATQSKIKPVLAVSKEIDNSVYDEEENNTKDIEATIGKTDMSSKTIIWLLLLFVLMAMGGFGLYFFQNKDNQVDDIEILE